MRLIIILTVLVTLLFSSCEDKYVSSIPDSRVYMELNLNSAEYNKFQSSLLYTVSFERELEGITENGYVIVTNPTDTIRRSLALTEGIGYSGLLIINGFDYKIYAYDMCCPYEHKKATKVHLTDTGKARCDSCKTIYDLSYGIGNPESGPSRESLRRYKTLVSGTTLTITR